VPVYLILPSAPGLSGRPSPNRTDHVSLPDDALFLSEDPPLEYLLVTTGPSASGELTRPFPTHFSQFPPWNAGNKLSYLTFKQLCWAELASDPVNSVAGSSVTWSVAPRSLDAPPPFLLLVSFENTRSCSLVPVRLSLFFARRWPGVSLRGPARSVSSSSSGSDRESLRPIEQEPRNRVCFSLSLIPPRV